MKNIMIVVLLILMIRNCPAQFENADLGARAVGLNGAITSLSDNSLSVFYNPSGLGQMKYREISIIYSPSQFGISEISTSALTYAEPLKFGTLGLAFRTFGFELYRENNVILSYGNKYKGKLFYGLNLNYYNLSIQNYNSASTFGIDLGALAYITNFLKWGFFAKNISGSKIGESKESLSRVYRTGITVKPGEDLSMILEIEKDVKYPVSFRAGIEYSINDHADIRSGIGTEPVSFSGGISLNYKMFQIEYAIYNHNDLGITNTGTITINFGGEKARKLSRQMLKKAFEK